MCLLRKLRFCVGRPPKIRWGNARKWSDDEDSSPQECLGLLGGSPFSSRPSRQACVSGCLSRWENGASKTILNLHNHYIPQELDFANYTDKSNSPSKLIVLKQTLSSKCVNLQKELFPTVSRVRGDNEYYRISEQNQDLLHVVPLLLLQWTAAASTTSPSFHFPRHAAPTYRDVNVFADHRNLIYVLFAFE